MKRVGNLYQLMLNKKLISAVIYSGSVGKRKRKDVKMVLEDVEGYTEKIYDLILNNSYVPTVPKLITIHDTSSGKEREISIVPYFPDGIMHQLIVEVMKPVFMKGMYYWSCASLPKRGNAHAIKYVKRALKNDEKHTKYCAKLDIHHYYPSVSIPLLMEKLARKIKDKKFLNLIKSIVSSNPNGGLSIGFYINQWLANFFLEDLDRYICTIDGVKYYVRNMDDFVLLGSNKKKLHKAVRMIADYLVAMNLNVKSNWQVFKVDSRGIDFVGYRFFHGYTKLRRRNFLKLARHCRRITKHINNLIPVTFQSAAGLLSRVGMLKHCNGIHIRQKYFDTICDKPNKFLKDIAREYAKEFNKYNQNVMVCCI